eukprot:TRINITY_DN29248_c0_g2_i1.p1 TRINITY_DN29248_c0_g2~~TRINITY_DN29248_c0_g2_i1.p1  ORF type:complete len:1461 (-),score=208.92 TRINITY_DN29248_c0_g2_i1:7-4389(-)
MSRHVFFSSIIAARVAHAARLDIDEAADGNDSYINLQNGWCRDSAGKSVNYYWRKQEETDEASCRAECDRQVECIGYNYVARTQYCSIYAPFMFEAPAGWKFRRGSGAAEITKGNGVKGTSCLKRSDEAYNDVSTSRVEPSRTIDWSYEDEDSWPGKFENCRGVYQSPIDINTSDIAGHGQGSLLRRLALSKPPVPAVVQNNGRFLESSGSFGVLRLPDGNFSLRRIQVHFPSEHSFNGVLAAGELHLVHERNGAEGNGTVVIVAIPMQESNDGLDVLRDIGFAKAIPNHTETFGVSDVDLVALKTQLAGDFYHYSGSLTSPPCIGQVRWYVMQNPAMISPHQVRSAIAALPSAQNRKTQPLNGRKILRNQIGIETEFSSSQVTLDTETISAKSEANHFLNVETDLAWDYGSDLDWGKTYPFCSGKTQSPVDIALDSTLEVGSSLVRRIAYNTTKSHVDRSSEYLPFVRGLEGSLLLPGGLYSLQRIDFHFPSEHTVNGKAAAGEAQLVHIRKSKIGATQVAIVSILLENIAGPSEESVFLNSIGLGSEGVAAETSTVDLEKLSSSLNGDFAHYRGSLTRPPCTEAVSWYIMLRTARMNTHDIERFSKSFPLHNGRRVQPLNGRKIVHNIVSLDDEFADSEARTTRGTSTRTTTQTTTQSITWTATQTPTQTKTRSTTRTTSQTTTQTTTRSTTQTTSQRTSPSLPPTTTLLGQVDIIFREPDPGDIVRKGDPQLGEQSTIVARSEPLGFVELGGGFCREGKYASSNPAEAPTRGECARLCSTEEHCYFFSYVEKLTCSRYRLGPCSVRTEGIQSAKSFQKVTSRPAPTVAEAKCAQNAFGTIDCSCGIDYFIGVGGCVNVVCKVACDFDQVRHLEQVMCEPSRIDPEMCHYGVRYWTDSGFCPHAECNFPQNSSELTNSSLQRLHKQAALLARSAGMSRERPKLAQDGEPVALVGLSKSSPRAVSGMNEFTMHDTREEEEPSDSAEDPGGHTTTTTLEDQMDIVFSQTGPHIPESHEAEKPQHPALVEMAEAHCELAEKTARWKVYCEYSSNLQTFVHTAFAYSRDSSCSHIVTAGMNAEKDALEACSGVCDIYDMDGHKCQNLRNAPRCEPVEKSSNWIHYCAYSSQLETYRQTAFAASNELPACTVGLAAGPGAEKAALKACRGNCKIYDVQGNKCTTGTTTSIWFNTTHAPLATTSALPVTVTDQPGFASVSRWNYDSAGAWRYNFPECNGWLQSPINISTAQAPTSSERVNMANLMRYTPGFKRQLANGKGHILTVTGGFGSIHLPGGEYELKQLSFHFPAEHVVDGWRADGEMQMVHQLKGSVGTENISIAAVLLQRAETDRIAPDEHQFFSDLGFERALPSRDQALEVQNVNVSRLSRVFNGDFFRYDGSLTTPPCTERVQWFVFASFANVSDVAFMEIAKVFRPSGNVREAQGINGRRVVRNAIVVPRGGNS